MLLRAPGPAEHAQQALVHLAALLAQSWGHSVQTAALLKQMENEETSEEVVEDGSLVCRARSAVCVMVLPACANNTAECARAC